MLLWLSQAAATNVVVDDNADYENLSQFPGIDLIATSLGVMTSLSDISSSTTTNIPPNSSSAVLPSRSSTTSSSKSPSVAGPIAGGVVGGLAAIIAVLFLLWWLRRRHIRRLEVAARVNVPPEPFITSPPRAKIAYTTHPGSMNTSPPVSNILVPQTQTPAVSEKRRLAAARTDYELHQTPAMNEWTITPLEIEMEKSGGPAMEQADIGQSSQAAVGKVIPVEVPPQYSQNRPP